MPRARRLGGGGGERALGGCLGEGAQTEARDIKGLMPLFRPACDSWPIGRRGGAADVRWWRRPSSAQFMAGSAGKDAVPSRDAEKDLAFFYYIWKLSMGRTYDHFMQAVRVDV